MSFIETLCHRISYAYYSAPFKLKKPNSILYNLTLYYQNARGLRSKTHTFYVNACELAFDIIVVTESWLNDSVKNAELFPSNYNVVRCDRKFDTVARTMGGGVVAGLI
ncbi:hypothetical protein, partial [Klebsiella pneumoniae]|uniref:hypothetical protein n=1 Tax=Klebsiella pneumoniae TaxID=573 RepID=UPI0019D717E1